jgi:hypothetical protein
MISREEVKLLHELNNGFSKDMKLSVYLNLDRKTFETKWPAAIKKISDKIKDKEEKKALKQCADSFKQFVLNLDTGSRAVICFIDPKDRFSAVYGSPVFTSDHIVWSQEFFLDPLDQLLDGLEGHNGGRRTEWVERKKATQESAAA